MVRLCTRIYSGQREALPLILVITDFYRYVDMQNLTQASRDIDPVKWALNIVVVLCPVFETRLDFIG